MSGDDSFLARWSRRKAQAKQQPAPDSLPAKGGAGPGAGDAPTAPAVAAPPRPPRASAPAASAPALAPTLAPEANQDVPTVTAAVPQSGVQEPPPTLADAAALPRGADVSRFMAAPVGEDVKRVALRKLFADPHFNVMDGLDTYIDDYSKPAPIPLAVLRKMAQSELLGLFDAPPPREAGGASVHDATRGQASPDGAPVAAVPQSPTGSEAVPLDEDPDLRLQQDHAAGPRGPGEGPAA